MSDYTIVIGAGLSGLAAAHRLHAAGKKVVVLESSERPGGRVVRVTHKGDAAEAGAQGIHSGANGYHELLKLVDEFGLSGDLIPQANHQPCYLDRKGNHVFPSGNLGMTKLLGVRGTADLAWFAVKYLILMKSFSLYETNLDIPDYDNISTADEFAWASESFKDYVLRPASHAMVGTDIEYTNLYHFLNLMKLVTSTKVSTLRQGNSSLTEAIAASLEVRYNSTVEKLIYKSQRVTGVQLSDGSSMQADNVIVACPIGAAAKIMPTQLSAQRDFLSKFPNIPMTLAYFFLDRPLDTQAFVYMGHGFRNTTFNMALNHTVKTPHLVSSGRGIISAWPCYPDTTVLAKMSDSDVTAKALGDMEVFFPGIASMVDEAKVQRHHWGLGRLSPGQHGKILAFKKQAEELQGVFFASNDYDGVHMESAVQSGLRAASRVLRG